MAITNNSKSTVRDGLVYVSSNPILGKLAKFWDSPQFMLVGVAAAMIIFLYSGYALIITLVTSLVMYINIKSPRVMPLKMPKSSGAKVDRGSLQAGTERTTTEAKAITCIGIDRETGVQVWEDSDNERRHNFFAATTGSGKTYGLRFNMMMALTQTTGVIAVDGKGDIELPLEAVSIVRRFMRDDDIRILNFKQGNRNVYSESGTPRTNTFNPFATGSSTYIAEVLKALLSGDEGGKGDMWQKRAEAMCENIAKMSTYKRDHSDFKIRPTAIAEMLELRELCRIYVDKNIPQEYKNSLKNYFVTLPDFELEQVPSYAAGEAFQGKILEQHGYVAMQLQPTLQVLSDLYGFIFDTDSPEIDLKDVVINNRFLMVLLPAMEQSEGTLQNTGKIILAALKGMIAGELGSSFEGNVKETLSERACSDPAPFKTFFDECGYYAAISGIEILPAQGRGLGFAFQFICQVYTDLEKGGKETADIIWGNCNNKTIGKTETESTYNKVNDRLGETTVMVKEGIDIRSGEVMSSRVNTDRIAYVKRRRLEMQDLTVLREGQYYYITNDKLISLQMGDPQIKSKVSETRYNQLIGLAPISEKVQLMLSRDYTTAINRFKRNLKGANDNAIKLDSLPTLRGVINLYRAKVQGVQNNHDTLTLFQKGLYDISMKANDDLENLSSDRMGAMISKIVVDETDKNKSDSDSSDDDVLASRPSSTNIDELASNDNSDWGAIPTNDEGYKEFSYNKPSSFDDESRLEEVSELEGELEYLKLQLEGGSISQDEYDEEVSIIKSELEENNTTPGDEDAEGVGYAEEGEDDGSGDPFEAAIEQDTYSIEQLNIDSLTNIEKDNTPFNDESYPSDKGNEFTETRTYQKAADVIAQLEKTFQIDI